jgi:hypothetical protein
LIAFATATSIILGAIGILAINLSKAYYTKKKADYKFTKNK